MMNKIDSLTWDWTVQSQPRDFSALRITSVVLGIIVAVVGLLIIYKTRGLVRLGQIVGWVSLVTGSLAITLAVSIRRCSFFDSAKDLTIGEEVFSHIQANMQNILHGNEEEGIKFYNSQGNHRVFSLETAPGLIFKLKTNKARRMLAQDDSMKARYEMMMRAQKVCHTYQLNLLVIPTAKLFVVKTDNQECEVIVERRLDINHDESMQEYDYERDADSLDEAIYQLAIFICKTGYSDVQWRNNPVIKDVDKKGNRKIALFDIEEMDGAETGLFGGLNRRGLVGCVNERQCQIVKKVAEENGVSTMAFAIAFSRRKKELEEQLKLKQHYLARKINSADEPIEIDVLSLDFAGLSSDKITKLQMVATNLKDAINERLANSSPEESLKARRCIYININDDKRFEEILDLEYIFDKFIQMGLIYKVDKRKGHGYFIQV